MILNIYFIHYLDIQSVTINIRKHWRLENRLRLSRYSLSKSLHFLNSEISQIWFSYFILFEIIVILIFFFSLNLKKILFAWCFNNSKTVDYIFENLGNIQKFRWFIFKSNVYWDPHWVLLYDKMSKIPDFLWINQRPLQIRNM